MITNEHISRNALPHLHIFRQEYKLEYTSASVAIVRSILFRCARCVLVEASLVMQWSERCAERVARQLRFTTLSFPLQLQLK